MIHCDDRRTQVPKLFLRLVEFDDKPHFGGADGLFIFLCKFRIGVWIKWWDLASCKRAENCRTETLIFRTTKMIRFCGAGIQKSIQTTGPQSLWGGFANPYTELLVEWICVSKLSAYYFECHIRLEPVPVIGTVCNSLLIGQSAIYLRMNCRHLPLRAFGRLLQVFPNDSVFSVYISCEVHSYGWWFTSYCVSLAESIRVSHGWIRL